MRRPRTATRSVSGGRRSSCSNVLARSTARSRGGGRLLRPALLAAAGLRARRRLVLDHVLGRLAHHAAAVVEALAAGAPGDLLELAHRAGCATFSPSNLREPREEHGADRDVDADAERVGAADDAQQALLRELLDEQPVLRQQARVVDADAVARGSASGPCRRACRSGSRRAPRRCAARCSRVATRRAGERLRELGRTRAA